MTLRTKWILKGIKWFLLIDELNFVFNIDSVYAKRFAFTLIHHHNFTKHCSKTKFDESVFAHYDWYTISDALDISITLHNTSACTLIKFNYRGKIWMAEWYSIRPYSVESRMISSLRYMFLVEIFILNKIVTTACEREMEAVKRIMTCHLACC